MSFQNLGNGCSWITDTVDEEQEILDGLDLLAGKSLSLLEKVVSSYLNLKQDASLDALQSCCSEIFKRASQCCENGKNYEITDKLPDDIN